MSGRLIRWDRAKLERLKRMVKEAEARGDDIFEIDDGTEFLVSYAKYLIEFMEDKL